MLVKLLEGSRIPPRDGSEGKPLTPGWFLSSWWKAHIWKSEEITCKKEKQSQSRELINSRKLKVVKE